MANKIRKGDEIIVLTGKDKGRTGIVTKVLPELDKVFVENINMVKKHQKPNPNANIQGGIIELERSIQLSNVAIYNTQTKKADKVGFRFLTPEDGQKAQKVRIYKSSGETINT